MAQTAEEYGRAENTRWKKAFDEGNEYRQRLLNELWRLAVNGSDGFRQWLYVRPWGHRASYDISRAALDEVEGAVACNPDPIKAAEQIYRLHG